MLVREKTMTEKIKDWLQRLIDFNEEGVRKASLIKRGRPSFKGIPSAFIVVKIISFYKPKDIVYVIANLYNN